MKRRGFTLVLVNELTKFAISQRSASRCARSPKLKQSESRIALIEQRLAVTEERIDYTSKKKWTNYISTNPVDIIQNIFGGGDVKQDEIAIASLEIRTADLLAAKAELERQQEEEKLKIKDKVLRLVLDYEAAQRRHELLSSQLDTLEQQREVMRIAYRMGRGSTSQILGMEDKRDLPFGSTALRAWSCAIARCPRNTSMLPKLSWSN